jgi:inner membrane transporter RhtA
MAGYPERAATAEPVGNPAGGLSAALPYLALLGAVSMLPIATSFAKRLFPLVGAPGVTSYRVTFAALILLAIWRPWRMRLSRPDLIAAARYGAVLGLMNLSFYMAIRTIPLGVAIAIEFLGPLAVALSAARRAVHVLWVALTVAGLALLLPIGPDVGRLDLGGAGFALAAAAFWALYIVFGKRTSHLHAGVAVALGMSTAAIVVVPFGVATAGLKLLSPAALGLGLLVAICTSAIPYSLEMVALKGIPRRTFGVLLSIEPVAGALAGLVLLGERLTALQGLAIACIVAASAGAVLTSAEAERGYHADDAPAPTA